MRRIILLVTAFIVTFGVFANGPMTATAPSLASVFGHFDSSAIRDTAGSYITPGRSAKPAPATPAADAKPSALSNQLHMSAIETIDLAQAMEPAHAATEFDGMFDEDGWVTLAYDGPEMPEVRPLAKPAEVPAVSYAKSGSRATRNTVFTGRILSKPTEIHSSNARDNMSKQGKRSLFEPVMAQLRVETADGRSPAMKLVSKQAVRTIAKQRSSSSSAHTIVFTETAEALSLIESAAPIENANASDRPAFVQTAFRAEPKVETRKVKPATLVPADLPAPAVPQFIPAMATLAGFDQTSSAARFLQSNAGSPASVSPAPAPALRHSAPMMGSTVNFDDTPTVVRFLGANADKSLFTTGIPAPPARIIKTEPATLSHGPEFSASLMNIDTLDLDASGAAGKPLGSRVSSGLAKSGIFARSKTNIFANRDVTASLSHPVPTEAELSTAPAESVSVTAEMPKLTDHTGISAIEPEFADAQKDPSIWLSSYATTSPEFTAASLERPKAVSLTPKRAAVVVTGMTTLNIAPMKRAADGGYCDSNYIGEPIRFSQTAQLTLEDLLLQIHNRFGINFLMGPNVGSLPINIKAGAIPWNVLLRSQLFISGVRAKCIDATTIELVENKTLSSLQDGAEVKTRFVKLKFLQRTGGGTVDLANRSQGGQNGGQGGGCGGSQGGQSGGGQVGGGGGQGGGQQGETAGQQSSTKFDKLIVEIEKILGIRSMTESSVGSGGGGGQGTSVQQGEVVRTNRFVTQIPGRNILAIRATDEEHELIDQIIARADRAPFQVVIKALVYTANQDKLRDIGVQTTIFDRTGRDRGGIFGHTLGGGGTLFDFSTIIGTFDFNIQATALQQNGIISVKSRPFATVLDGLCTTLNVGRSIPIVIDSTLGGQGDVVFVDASNNLAVTPYVIDDDNGDPMAVTLELRLGANDVDTSVTARDIPAISQRSIQTQLLLGEDKTAILGGFTVDSDTSSVSKTPGLGDIPIIGELFKRRVKSSQINRLYFAISASVIPFGEVIRPVDVPGATTDPPSITPKMKERADKAEPTQVKGP